MVDLLGTAVFLQKRHTAVDNLKCLGQSGSSRYISYSYKSSPSILFSVVVNLELLV